MLACSASSVIKPYSCCGLIITMSNTCYNSITAVATCGEHVITAAMTKHNHSIHSLAYRRFQANENNVDLIKLTREDLSQVSVSNEFAIMKVKRETGCLGFGKIGRGQSTCLHPLCSECVVFLLFSPYVHVCVCCVFIWMSLGSSWSVLLLSVGDGDFYFPQLKHFWKNVKLLSGENFQLPRK